MDLGELVLFQPVLQAYPTRHTWIITTDISLGNLECHCTLFNRQLTRTQQFLKSLDQHPSASTQLLSTLQLELSNIQDIYNSGECTITSAIKLLQSNQPQNYTCTSTSIAEEAYYLFLEMPSVGLTRTATAKTSTALKHR